MACFVIFGQRGSGKDTATEIFAKYLPNFKQMRLAQYVVECAKGFGIENPTRTQLVLIGEKMGREMIGENVWLDMATKDVQTSNYDWVVSDCRYINEYERFVELGFIPILIDTELDTCIERVIKRDGTIDLKLLEGKSEQTFKQFDYLHKLDNNGTIKELEEQIKEIIIKYWED